ncbi:uncharacterized protein N7496_000462 [Penicillium cataractarum]|uniref:Uncharacterized protein n=1 Tax=Penicillium cataractarum TaxID=2100454 RepID=A0A9W9VUC2_9EURO|nr:uncharacterized protein N7496_000462 [Penicillium cataractarum]KAJ5389394.1 hypothetical protein N7496_000462 [Penicillium cataractarum]
MSENSLNKKADEAQQLPRAQRTRFSTTSLVKILFVLLSFAILIWTFQGHLSRRLSSYTRTAEEPDLVTELPQRDQTPDIRCYFSTKRYDIQSGMTACYPTSGGIWLAELGPVELQYLGINRFDSTERSWNEAEEDQFCHELRKFGGCWHNPKSPYDLWIGGLCSDLYELEPVFSIDRRVAFPAKGGVWVLSRDEETRRFPRGIVGVNNALTMEERSMVLERLGAVYCDDVAECHLLDDLKKEPRDLAGNQDL